MAKGNVLEEVVLDILHIFNNENNKAGNTNVFRIEVIEKEGKNKTFSGHIHLVNEENNGVNTIIYNNQIPLPEKHSERLLNKWKTPLFKAFLYDCVGLLAVSTARMVDTQLKASYDGEKGRLKPDVKWEGRKIKTTTVLQEDAWYKGATEYEIFTQTDNGWGVYSDLDIHKANNGIGIIPGINARLVEEETV